MRLPARLCRAASIDSILWPFPTSSTSIFLSFFFFLNTPSQFQAPATSGNLAAFAVCLLVMMAMVVDPMRCVGRKRRMAAHARIPGVTWRGCTKAPAPRYLLLGTSVAHLQVLCQRLCSTPCEQFAGAIKLRRCAVSRPAVHLCSCSLFAQPAARKSVENKPKSTRRTRFAGAATLAQLRQSQKCYPKSRADGRYLHPPRQLTEPHQPGSCMYCVCT